MKPSRIDGLALCIVLIIMGCALGCVQPYDPGSSSAGSSSSSSSSAGSGGAGGGDACTDGGVEFPIDTDISFPDCVALGDMLILQGTVDGKPFEKSYTEIGTFFNRLNSPPSLELKFGYEGDFPRYASRLTLYWREPTYPIRHSIFFPVSVGTLSLQEDTLDRAVNPGSTVRIGCDNKLFQFVIDMDSGEFLGCARL